MPWNYNWKLPHYPSKNWAVLIREKVYQDNERRFRFKRLNRRFFPGFGALGLQASTQFFKTVPELNTKGFVTWQGDTMPTYPHPYTYPPNGGTASAGIVKAGYGNAAKAENPQYVSVVRHHGSSFGKKKRYTLKKMKRELRANDVMLKSRFQTFQSDGFQNGVGGRLISFGTPATDTQCGCFPFHIWDVTSLPIAYESGELISQPVIPVRGYQLAFNTTNAAAREYQRFGWIPMLKANRGVGPNLKLSLGGDYGNNNIAIPTEKTGVYINSSVMPQTALDAPYAAGFKHDWSDIQLVLYPQTALPTKWHVALISFPQTLPHNDYNPPAGFALESAGPNRAAYNSNTTSVRFGNNDEYYSAERAANYPGHDNMDYRWQKFWSGKLQNPINRDESAVGTMHPADAKLPFKIIEHESFYQPARDNPTFGGTAQRLIKKLFYRRDWTFPPGKGVGYAERQGDALNNLDTIQLHASPEFDPQAQSSPFSGITENVYLAIWCEHYQSFVTNTDIEGLSNAPQPGVTNLPSYDLVVRMKHTLNTTQMALNKGVPRPDALVNP